MRAFLNILLFLLLLTFLSCQDSNLNQALGLAQNNRQELDSVLRHYSESGDTLKLSSARFLISDMPYNYSLYGDGVEKYDSAYIAMTREAHPNRADAFKNMTVIRGGVTGIPDIECVGAEHLIHAIDAACDTWSKTTWSKDYPIWVFHDYVLPYRIMDEGLSDWRTLLDSKYPFLKQNTVLSKRGEQLQAESAEHNSSEEKVEGASKGGMVMLDAPGEKVTYELSSSYKSVRHLYVRYTALSKDTRLCISLNGNETDTIILNPTNALHSFTTSREAHELILEKGKNTLTLSYAGDAIGVDYVQINSVEDYDNNLAEDFSNAYYRIVSNATNNAITIDSANDSLPCAGVASAINGYDMRQSLRLECRGYGCWSIFAHDDTTDLCLESEYCSVEQDSPVGLYNYLNGDNQRWVFLPAGSGLYRIMNKDSGMFLEAKSIGVTDTLAQNPFHGGDSQLWRVEKAGTRLSSDSTFTVGSAISEAMRIFDITGQYEWVGYEGGIPPKATSLLTGKTGNCRDEANYTVYLCRNLGIPSAVDFTPHWGNRSLAHSWSVIIKPDGTGTPFYMGCTPCDTAHYYHPYKKPKVFRYRFRLNRQYASDLSMEKDVPSLFKLPKFTDVTDEYYKTTDVTRSVPNDSVERRIAYICVFDNRNWVPVHYGVVKTGKVTFSSMGRGIMYMAAFYEDGVVKPFGNPFCIEYNGEVRDIDCNVDKATDMSLLRKYPFMGKEDFFNLRMSGGKFQGSNTADFSKCTNLYIFEGATSGNWYDVSIDNTDKFRYLRYIGPATSHCNINEMEFYDESGIKIKGTIIGTEGEPWALKESVFDGNILTGFNSISPDGNWVGLKLNKPHAVSRIRFIGRNDGNGIEIGDRYELLYWNNGWKFLGEMIAESNTLVFRNVPSRGLYVLRNLTKGHEERIFTYENGEQVWW